MSPTTDISYALRLPKKTHTALKRIAKDERRSLNQIIVIACEEFAERNRKP